MNPNKTPVQPHDSATSSKVQSTTIKVSKKRYQTLEHEYKLALVRECQIYGKSYDEANEYFSSKGLKLSLSNWKLLRAELKNTKSAKNWFSKEAMYVMEEDHMLSVETIREVERKTVQQLMKLIDDEDLLTTVDFKTGKDGAIQLRVRNYQLELFMKLTAQFESLQMTKTKMFSATPVVQEMMEVHRMHDEENALRPAKTERPLTNG